MVPELHYVGQLVDLPNVDRRLVQHVLVYERKFVSLTGNLRLFAKHDELVSGLILPFLEGLRADRLLFAGDLGSLALQVGGVGLGRVFLLRIQNGLPDTECGSYLWLL